VLDKKLKGRREKVSGKRASLLVDGHNHEIFGENIHALGPPPYILVCRIWLIKRCAYAFALLALQLGDVLVLVRV
jgi:hypothetical protein